MDTSIPRRRRTAAFAIALSTGLAAGGASALTIDFEGEVGSVGNTGDSIVLDGFEFTLADIEQEGFLRIVTQDDIVESGTTKLFAANRAAVTMTKADGGAFSILSFDLGGSFTDVPTRWADGVRVEAMFSGGGSTSLLVDLPDSDPSYVGTTWAQSNVESLSFTPEGSNGTGTFDFEFVLDNIVVDEMTPIPLPAGLPLLAAALGATGLVARRRRAG